MKYLINLLPDKKEHIADRIIYFSFHYLRYILVITQFVAICTFFYRFKVDQEIVDLRDMLKQKKVIVESTRGLLKEVDRVDRKLSYVSKSLVDQQKTQDAYEYLFSRLPEEMNIVKLSFSKTEITIQGTAPGISLVQEVYQRIKNENRFQSVELKSIVKEKEGYAFLLSLASYR